LDKALMSGNCIFSFSCFYCFLFLCCHWRNKDEYRKTFIKHRVPNKRRGILTIQSCQSTSRTLVTSYVIVTPTLSARVF